MLPKPLIAASLEPIMLTLLRDEAMYGYQILQRVETLSGGKIQWTANKLYPLLHSLENRDLVRSFWKPSDTGPDRKYYELTDKGSRSLRTAQEHWLDLNAILSRLWGPMPAPGRAVG